MNDRLTKVAESTASLISAADELRDSILAEIHSDSAEVFPEFSPALVEILKGIAGYCEKFMKMDNDPEISQWIDETAYSCPAVPEFRQGTDLGYVLAQIHRAKEWHIAGGRAA